jgi:hypothetical protein
MPVVSSFDRRLDLDDEAFLVNQLIGVQREQKQCQESRNPLTELLAFGNCASTTFTVDIIFDLIGPIPLSIAGASSDLADIVNLLRVPTAGVSIANYRYGGPVP